MNRYRCNSKDILIEQRAQKKKILQRCADPLYLIPSNPCNAALKYSFIGTRILMSLTWRTRCIRNAPCRCTAYAVSSFSAPSVRSVYLYYCSGICSIKSEFIFVLFNFWWYHIKAKIKCRISSFMVLHCYGRNFCEYT